VTLEKTIEDRAVRELAKLGITAIKFGTDGWPDRVVPYAPGRVIWLEFKTPEGNLRPNQKIRHKQLNRMKQEVAVVRSWKEAVAAVIKARRSLARTDERRRRADKPAPE